MLFFLQYYKAAGGHLVFKHHVLYHLTKQSRLAGNPRFYWTYVDEGVNRVLSQVAQSVHHGS
eukprot:4620598-Pyramimonas_sp.AAC.1